MVKLAFRAYCDGANLVGLAFQADTGVNYVETKTTIDILSCTVNKITTPSFDLLG